MRVPSDLSEVILGRLLKVAEQRGWHTSYDDRDEEIYVLRSGADAAQIRCRDGMIRIDASDTRQGELEALLAESRQSVLTDAAACVPQAQPAVMEPARVG